jgi:hypothetical protein
METRRTTRRLIELMLGCVVIAAAPMVSAGLDATTITTTAHLPISKQVFNSATNETVYLADAEAMFRVTFTNSGGTQVEVSGHLRAKGKGAASGAAYDLMVGGKASINASRPPLPEFILTCNGQLAAAGTAGSLPVVVALAITVNARGEVSAAVRDITPHRQ